MKASTFAAYHGIVLMILALVLPAVPTAAPAEVIELTSTVGLFGGIFFGAVALGCALHGE